MSAAAAIFNATNHANGQPAPPKPFVAVVARRQTLWEIDANMIALDEILEENGGEISDPQVEAILDEWFAECKSDLNNKVDGYVGFIAELTARAEVRKAEADRLAFRAKVDNNLKNSLKERLKLFLEAKAMKKLETKRYKVTVAGNGGKLPLQLSPKMQEHPENLPAVYQKIQISPNTDAIRTDLEAGKPIDFASLGERGTHLRIS